ncbi:MAG: glycosyl transferase [Rickettsiales bacterium]|nr:MAG: glycosyl transferase [Rickettsiales bacterium]
MNDFNTPKIIISLTSYPARINTVDQTIKTLLTQTYKVDEIILWLGIEQFPNKEQDLPKQLLSLEEEGLTIKYCKDIKSYKKLIPALIEYKDDVIITVDDDILYENDRIEKLVRAYKNDPTEIHCHRGRQITFNNRKIAEYNKCLFYFDGKKGFDIFFTGAGGVLYPPHCLYEYVLNENLFMKLAPTADDIWFWAMAILQNTKINIVKDGYYKKIIHVNGTRENSLWSANKFGKNDEQIKNILKYYPKILKKILKDNKQKIENESKKEKIYLFGIPILTIKTY